MSYAGSLEGYFQSWEITEGEESTEITQLVAPIRVFLPFTDNLDVRIASSYTSFARSLDSGGSESVSGLTDVRIQANYALLDRKLLIGLIANVPTGGGKLTGSEQDIVFDFISPDLSVRANRLGEGFNAGGTISLAVPVSNSTILSLGGGLIGRGGYDTELPTSETPFALSPGIIANGSAGVDFFTGGSHVRIASTFTYYGTERVDDTDYYRIGPEIAIGANYGLAYAESRGSFNLGLHQIIRMDNSAIIDREFVTEDLSTNGSYLAVSASNDYAVARSVSIDVSALLRAVGKNDLDAGDATVLEGGLGVSVLATDGVVLRLGGRYITGSGTGFSGLDREITGFEGVFGLTAQLPQ
jgi:hypothetical protein